VSEQGGTYHLVRRALRTLSVRLLIWRLLVEVGCKGLKRLVSFP
jgi:hypothetical protein